MRTLPFLLLASLAIGTATARAADLDYGVLRGPEYEPVAPAVDWNGGYFGAHAGYSSTSLGFRNVFGDMIRNALHDTSTETNLGASTLLRAQSVRVDHSSFGGFAGYNFQFDDIVLGIEADYTRFGKTGTSFDTTGRSKVTGDLLETVYLNGSSSTRIQDYGTIRARAGYAMGSLLPFVTGGLAIGRATVVDKLTYQAYGFNQTTYNANQGLTTGKPAYVYNYGYTTFLQSSPDGSTPATDTLARAKTKVVGGITAGAGLEFALTQNILLRGEYQYVLFNDFDGHKANVNTVRGGAAVKF
ncbi:MULTISPECIES: outer membrane beta-barrel protein [Methylobacterium]|uniref:Outer membrane protein beta-barrel domain-containing protein n=3 Tax=Pseudomonadota TaxID=1224 RepID=A0ABQ4SZP1_9HYPH|nr:MULTISPECIES: outer membrane beta-barrel protein [Methylobacterium]PIU05319.1 MAG: porin [Methylobacterium sp. CG09_land_8_20_14_0_10_71_15]PIU15991.1 MAG: porin [Methylobacterium sp. CG08_land_8_20_14_0_20_71_15]GBU19913.1 porin [Methylobacterium sp.]GJE07358.1 hypothetical protein AOPFMNJM_2686 [Methylobacterium jeotgali]